MNQSIMDKSIMDQSGMGAEMENTSDIGNQSLSNTTYNRVDSRRLQSGG
uniref:Uncharacterized protein n=1 Tax=Candidatus Methanophaga sp. ANME-1 ERB7 TaxID=2759913 RepID=A0A7G9ZBF5_9EURY|nr:hypothetical protein GIFCIIHN_00005 [Methanosarcinales archaeon ANME-1 ERB7]